MRFSLFAVLASLLCITLPAQAEPKPYGDPASIEYAEDLWVFMEDNRLAGNNAISTYPYKGFPPHGIVLELLELPIAFKGTMGHLIIKRNYGGDGLSIEEVINNPKAYLKSISIMFQRDKDYDPENNNWFYARYNKDGTLSASKKGTKMAGRLAKGMSGGCIACHSSADGGDFIFSHDRYGK